MAQVPYSPVPDVQPNLQPTRPIGINTPEDAFGAPQARALGQMGKVLDTASSEIAVRAEAMQHLKNEADARDASVKFSNDASQLYAQFREQYGANAGPDALMKFQQDMGDLRAKNRNGLNNPVAQSLYDADSTSQLMYLNRGAAIHSSEQLKQYSMATDKASVESTNNLMQLNPRDDSAAKAGLDNIETRTRALGDKNGWTPEETEQQVQIAKSNAVAGRIQALARTDPQAATAMFGQAVKDGQLRGETIGKVQQFLDNQNRKISSKEIADNTHTGANLGFGEKPVTIERAMDAIGTKESSNSYDIIGPVTTHKVNGKMVDDHPLGRYGVMESNLQDWLKQSGLPSMTSSQFVANHDAQDQVFKKIFGDSMQKTGSFNKAADAWLGGGNADGLGTTHAAYLAATNAALAKTATLAEKQGIARAKADALSPDDPGVGDEAVARVDTLHAQDETAQRDEQQQLQNTVHAAIAGQMGKGTLTVEGLEQDPQVKAAIERQTQLDPNYPIKLQMDLRKEALSDNVPTTQRTTNYNHYLGTMYTDPETFKQQDLYSLDLTGEQRAALVTNQKKLLQGGTVEDKQVKASMKSPAVKDILTTAGITDKEDLSKITGAVHDEVNEMRQQGKTVSDADIQKVTQGMIADHATDGAVFGKYWQSHEPIYSAQVPEERVPKITEQLTKQLGRDPTPTEIQRFYTLMLFNHNADAKNVK